MSSATEGHHRLPFYVGGEARAPNYDLLVMDKYSQTPYAQVALASAADVDEAISQAHAARKAMASLPSYKRKAILEHAAAQMVARKEELAHALCAEAGKPIKDARGEVGRMIDTFVLAAEESTRQYGEWAPMDLSKRGEGLECITRRFPLGPVSMVTPFNFPLNLVAHKVAPAIAAGCPFVVKPSDRTPVGALLIAEILASGQGDAEMPRGSFSVVPCTSEDANALTVSPMIKLLSFTGSPGVGWHLKEKAGKKKVTLELGGNAACIVDDIVPSLDAVINSLITGAFYQSGQSCISVQRVLIRSELYPVVAEALAEAASKLKMGDPRDEDTFVGPMISVHEAERVQRWLKDACSKGAKVLCGGGCQGAMHEATVVEGAPTECDIWSSEVFGPVACLESYDTFEDAVARVNESRFGLHAGVFTSSLHKAFYAFEQIEAGGVIINEVPSMRTDSQAYGGVKDSGIGREGVRYAMEDMSELKVMILKHAASLP